MYGVIDLQYPEWSIFRIRVEKGVRESIEEFKSLPDEEKRRIRCLRGHMWFGLHKYLPQLASYITILRDPIDRVISHYHFVKRAPTHRLHEEVISRKLKLGEYVSCGISPELSNGQVRLISGIETLSFIHNPISSDALA